MKRQMITALLITFFSLASTKVHIAIGSPGVSEITEADRRFLELQQIYTRSYSLLDSLVKTESKEKNIVLNAKIFATIESLQSKYRMEGLKFWHLYPKDNRRYAWFSTTMSQPLNFWKFPDTAIISYMKRESIFSSYDAELDSASLLYWESAYPKLLAEYSDHVSAPKSEQEDLGLISVYKIKEFILLSQNRSFNNTGKIDVKLVSRELEKIALDYPRLLSNSESVTASNLILFLSFRFIAGYKGFGLTTQEVKSFLDNLNFPENSALYDWKHQNLALLNSNVKYFTNLKGISSSGNTMNLTIPTGKVILIDLWNLGCISCIKRMPYLKQIYDKYKHRGFEIISLCMDDEKNKERVKSIEEKLGTTWPLMLIGNPFSKNTLGNQIWNEYGFHGVPQMLIFDMDGNLIQINNELAEGNFESLLLPLLDMYNVANNIH